jgi:uncharacterized membrane protein
VPEPDDPQPITQIHIEETIKAIGRLHAEHRATASRHHRVLGWVISLLGRPGFLIAMTLFVAAWIGLNSAVGAWGYRPLDPPPFQRLSTFASIASLYLVVLIVSTQRRDDRLDRNRELLTLELALLTEQKSAKAIALLEELRRDFPLVHDRVDTQADVLAKPADTHAVIDAITDPNARAVHHSGMGDEA